MDTVRIPVSLVPYEDPSARYQKQLKTWQNAGIDMSEAVPVEEVSEAEAGKDSVGRVSEAKASAGASAAEGTSTQTSEDRTAPPSDSPKKD